MLSIWNEKFLSIYLKSMDKIYIVLFGIIIASLIIQYLSIKKIEKAQIFVETQLLETLKTFIFEYEDIINKKIK